ncbi:hypothetical protein DFO66_102107 [Brevibacterium sanguinis]|uniref:Uncharacterized protein n=2 Tax=Brevibacterium TaxID=1696 RepID=A0A366INW3_9MICO|nr:MULTISPECIES: hypothetical protein [Brevibacterium]RBP67054.1 hypothetical protein DFO66_102107 [Brevibacterium sanguinis]RBP73579.1 hypothetical protein DFO65_102107 [Brevibacterium celere]
MNLPEFGMPERLNVPPFGEQRARLGRQIVLGLKVLAIVIVLWLIIAGVTSCVNAISNMGSTASGHHGSVGTAASSAVASGFATDSLSGLGQ